MKEDGGLSVAICCSSRDALIEEYTPHVVDIMRVLKALPRPARVTYGGGRVGLMGSVREEAERRGLPVVGYNLARWIADGDSQEEIFPTLSDRQRAVLNQDVVIFLPGGIGTLYEMTQVLAEAEVREEEKRMNVVYDPCHYFDPFFSWYSGIVSRGAARPLQCHVVREANALRSLLDARIAEMGAPIQSRDSQGHDVAAKLEN